ncbi:hypothetical protein Psal027_03672 (plasmid) [Piscirickettsia salmonis]|nr:helix-turn-helix domain protein [Piscirickettsia salmonis]QGN79361.1 hypothetical protein Psal001_03626 [Piscirickettsia salmonis]QGN82950.1 hypothetical protein Psal002_03650 [Piscirickettsia salmonis]QGN86465.1 hypothetical protein Psal003_03574 [Piscirickettsia salmonis]QGN89969.1 hypothetical protein Psal004_03564 [Piscirickettsia salmonis]
MRLIIVEDYAALNKMRVQDVYALVLDKKLKHQDSTNLDLKQHKPCLC